jgi:hypothetical protein
MRGSTVRQLFHLSLSTEIDFDDGHEQAKLVESPITRLFGGKSRSTVRAPNQSDVITVEDWRSLQLNIQVRFPPFFPFRGD